jgi:hypothetical protein
MGNRFLGSAPLAFAHCCVNDRDLMKVPTVKTTLTNDGIRMTLFRVTGWKVP